jgi:hypothetical protein
MDAQVSDWIDKSQVAYEKGMTVLQDFNGWTRIKEANGVSGYIRDSDGTAHKTFKADFFVDKPPKWTARYIFENFPSLNMEFNDDDLEYCRETR